MRFLMLLLAMASMVPGFANAGEPVKHPIFLMFPTAADEERRDRMNAWSLYLEVDPSDPSKVLGLGLDSLTKQNGGSTSFEALQPKQADPAIARTLVQRLDATSFSGGQIAIEKDKALNVSLVPAAEGYELNLSMRTSVNGRFVIGAGKGKVRRAVSVKFDKTSKTWYACATALDDVENNVSLTKGGCVKFIGIAFSVTGIGIEKIIGVGAFDPVIIYYEKL